MQLKKSVVACALALAATPLFSNAAVSGPFQTPDVEVYLSGASAPDTYLSTVLTSLFNGTFYTFKDDKGTRATLSDDGSLYTAYFGEVKSGDSSIPASLWGKKVRLIKRSEGGSVWGVNPVARQEAIASLHISDVAHANGTAACTQPTGSAATTWACSRIGSDTSVAASGNKVPDFGVSDVAPNMFKAPYNVEYGKDQLSYAETAYLTVKTVNTLMMGLAVTNTVPSTTFFSPASFGAMLSGNITSWATQGVAIAKDNVIVCRRHPGSGTQTAYNWYFNNFPCTTASVAGSGDNTPATLAGSETLSGSGTSADPFVLDPTAFHALEHSTSGDVRVCLNKAQNGGTHNFQAADGNWYRINFGTGGYGAIGTLSVDSHGRETNATNGGWTFRNMHGAGELTGSTDSTSQAFTGTGIAPTQANLIEGKYDFAAELTMQYVGTRIGSSGVKYDFIETIINRAGQPARQSKATAAVSANATPEVDAYGVLTTTNISRASRGANMCSPLVKTL